MSQLIPLLDKNFDHRFVLTGQHYSKEMMDIFLEELGVRAPDEFLVMKNKEEALIASSDYSFLLPKINKEIKSSGAEYDIVYGDTNSTLATSLATIKNNRKLIHIEAGLRSFDKRMAEELVRVLVDHLSDILFPPTELTSQFLEKEGIKNNKLVVGNTIVDACLHYFKISKKKSKFLKESNLDRNEYVLATIHRAENVDDTQKLLKILQALSSIQKLVIFPMHPRTRRKIEEFGYKLPKNISTVSPIGYFDMLQLLKNCSFVVTDSGGVQEEAITLKVPCLTLRETTERWETIAMGANFLVGPDPLMINYYAKMIIETNLKERLIKIENPYGNGTASKKITKHIKEII